MTPRRRELESRLLSETVRQAGIGHAVDCQPYVAAVEQRLELGASRYGDNAFLRRDNLRELLEETPDVAGYALLELQRLGGDEADPSVYDALVATILHGALADHHARRGARAREEAGR